MPFLYYVNIVCVNIIIYERLIKIEESYLLK